MAFASLRLNRKFVWTLALACLFLWPGFFAPAFAADSGKAKEAPKKPLVVYFSHADNTGKLAEEIHKIVGGDILRIEPKQPYPKDQAALKKRAKREKTPELSTIIPNLNDYGVVFIGSPNWWGGLPGAVASFVQKSGMDGKTAAPFITHSSGGEDPALADLIKLLPHSKILTPLLIGDSNHANFKNETMKWIDGLGPALIMTTTGNPAIYPDGGY